MGRILECDVGGWWRWRWQMAIAGKHGEIRLSLSSTTERRRLYTPSGMLLSRAQARTNTK